MKKLHLILMLVLAVPALQAQDTEAVGLTWWVDPGIGTYTTFGKGENKLTFTLGASVQKNNTLYKLRYMYNHEVALFNSMSPPEYYNSYNFLLGRSISNTGSTQINILAGIGVTSGIKRDELLTKSTLPVLVADKYSSERFVTPSLPLELEFMFKPFRYMGIGAGLFFEINLKKPVFGFTGKAMLGRIK